MKKLYIAFVWHMHQPLYKDDLGQRVYLPWVRLHATKGYYDMPAMLKKFPKIRQTYNLTPSLLCQIKDPTENPSLKDIFLEMTLKPATDLNREEKGFILTHFFMNSWSAVVKQHPRYAELLNKRGSFASQEELERRIPKFSDQEFLDLQVLFNLMWFGYAFRKKEAGLQALLQKGKNFSEEDKREVVDLQFKAMRELIPLYRGLAEEGQIELATSPFYHPILPLIDDKTLGSAYCWEEDAEWQVREALRYFEQCFGKRPVGMWPSEGGVSQDVVSLFLNEQVRWIASDEEVLLRSLMMQGGQEVPVSAVGKREEVLYQPYRVSEQDRDLAVIFRDKRLSDLIGFSYATADPEAAAEDFLRRLRAIRDQLATTQEAPLVAVILDGENAWEHYPYGGERFLSSLYEKLSEDPTLETVTVREYLDRRPPRQKLSKLYAGSWIHHDFRIWYGHAEDRLGWDYLAKTRQFLLGEAVPEDIKDKVWREIYIAEGSDWYWWFGDDFSSATEDTFDFLFRTHLMNVYRLLNRRYPAYLKKPIKEVRKLRTKQEPVAFLNPVLDGEVTAFYEWVSAGLFKVSEPSEVMQQSERLVSEIHYGFNIECFFLRIDFCRQDAEAPWKGMTGVLHLHSLPEEKTVERDFEATFELYDRATVVIHGFEGERKVDAAELSDAFRLGRIAELAIPFNAVGFARGDEVQFTVAIRTASGIALEEWPRHGILQFRVPDESFESLMWNA